MPRPTTRVIWPAISIGALMVLFSADLDKYFGRVFGLLPFIHFPI